MNERIKLYLGDCLDVIPTLDKVDLVLTDLPYGCTQNKIDIPIPFSDMWSKLNLICKPQTPILLFGQGLFFAKLICSNEKLYKYDIVWNKVLPTGFLNAKRMPLRSHEQIAVFYSKLGTYNPQFSEGQPLHGRGTKYLTSEVINNNYGKFNNMEDIRKGATQKYPKSIVEFKKPHPSCSIHPTQKPVELLEYLIKTYSNENDVVLDFTMGSGSTGVACLNTNRKFIGIEKDKHYYDMAYERINKQ